MLSQQNIYDTSIAITGNIFIKPKIPLAIGNGSRENREARPSTLDSYITIYNLSTNPQQFYIIPEQPTFTSNDKPLVYTAVYQNSKKVASGTGTATFVIPENVNGDKHVDTCIVAGLAETDLANASRLFASDYKPLYAYRGDNNFRDSCSMLTMPSGFEPSFVKVQTQGIPKKLALGEMQITVDDSFNFPGDGHPFVGIGIPHRTQRNMLIPVCVWDAVPSSTYVIKPSKEWHCFRGDLGAGQFGETKIDTLISQIVVELPRPGDNRSVKYDKNGTFVKYDGLSPL
ncbi:hypothetical protein CC78DRAFT_619478 [Lojkania enalia]|uniref:Uncharacterized protein n=1 Tax=Lojkania enalia TaxID=147567 RepID=A0A9P4K3Q5_9PLEO|nr:hypothetical protein CC78DRAFT_619478 [Didymosphaeria enalia]